MPLFIQLLLVSKFSFCFVLVKSYTSQGRDVSKWKWKQKTTTTTRFTHLNSSLKTLISSKPTCHKSEWPRTWYCLGIITRGVSVSKKKDRWHLHLQRTVPLSMQMRADYCEIALQHPAVWQGILVPVLLSLVLLFSGCESLEICSGIL